MENNIQIEETFLEDNMLGFYSYYPKARPIIVVQSGLDSLTRAQVVLDLLLEHDKLLQDVQRLQSPYRVYSFWQLETASKKPVITLGTKPTSGNRFVAFS